jgi:hypothetical protein
MDYNQFKQYKDYIFSLAYPSTEQLYLIRAKVKTVELTNLEFFTKRKIFDFNKYNIIQGCNKSGKTFLSRLIYNAYLMGGTFLEDFPREFTGFQDARVDILYHSIKDWRYTFPKEKKYEDIHWEWKEKIKDKKNNIMCFLFDEPDIIYDENEREGFLNYLKGAPFQVIITSEKAEDYNYPKEYKLINI